MKKWLENYWYHYKWHTLIVLFFVVVITIMVVQASSREDNDIYIIYAGPELISDAKREEIKEDFAQRMTEDYDGDGVKSVDFMDIILMNGEELKQAYADGANQYFLNEGTVEQNKETLSVQAMAGDYVIFLIDPEWYTDLHKASAFVTFDELAELGFPSAEGAKRYDDCAYYLNTMNFAKFFTCFESFPTDTLVCVRRLTTASVLKGDKKSRAMYERHMDYYTDLLSFKLPEGYEPEGE